MSGQNAIIDDRPVNHPERLRNHNHFVSLQVLAQVEDHCRRPTLGIVSRRLCLPMGAVVTPVGTLWLIHEQHSQESIYDDEEGDKDGYTGR
jgi:hypothetical protein